MYKRIAEVILFEKPKRFARNPPKMADRSSKKSSDLGLPAVAYLPFQIRLLSLQQLRAKIEMQISFATFLSLAML